MTASSRSLVAAGSGTRAAAEDDRTRILRLPDGRDLAVAQGGDPEGRPVIHLHGLPGSRLERYVDDTLTAALGVRFITVDRPGYGSSSPSRPSLLGFADDIAALADHLGIGAFQAHAFSGGAPYALAMAARLADRVSHIAILAGVGPLNRPGAFEGMLARNVEEYRVARTAPERLPALLAERRPGPSLPDFELAVYARSEELLDMMLENHAEMTRQGFAGTIADNLALVADWGFDLASIATPVTLWHGDRDELVPCHHAEHVAALLPHARLCVGQGEGHFDMLFHQHEALATLPP